MIANYGYKDAEGSFYITVNTAKCAECDGKSCISSCPRDLFVAEEDPYGDEVIVISEMKRKKIKYECVECKPAQNRSPLPCVEACPYGALAHSW